MIILALKICIAILVIVNCGCASLSFRYFLKINDKFKMFVM